MERRMTRSRSKLAVEDILLPQDSTSTQNSVSESQPAPSLKRKRSSKQKSKILDADMILNENIQIQIPHDMETIRELQEGSLKIGTEDIVILDEKMDSYTPPNDKIELENVNSVTSKLDQNKSEIQDPIPKSQIFESKPPTKPLEEKKQPPIHTPPQSQSQSKPQSQSETQSQPQSQPTQPREPIQIENNNTKLQDTSPTSTQNQTTNKSPTLTQPKRKISTIKKSPTPDDFFSLSSRASSTADDFFSLSSKSKTSSIIKEPIPIPIDDDEYFSSDSDDFTRKRKKKIIEPGLSKTIFDDFESFDSDLSDDDFGNNKKKIKNGKQETKTKQKEPEITLSEDEDITPPPSPPRIFVPRMPPPVPIVPLETFDIEKEVSFTPDLSLLSKQSTIDLEEDFPRDNPLNTIIVSVQKKLDPRVTYPPENTEEGKKARKPYKFKIFKNDTFEKILKVLKDFYAKEGITSDITLRYSGVKVFSMSTPNSLRIKNGDVLEVAPVELEEYLEQIERELEAKRKKEEEELEALLSAETQILPDVAQDSNTVNLKIKFKNGDIEKVKVKKDSTFGSIISHLAKKKDVNESSIVLKIDGDKIQTDETPNSMDLEDDDMIDANC